MKMASGWSHASIRLWVLVFLALWLCLSSLGAPWAQPASQPAQTPARETGQASQEARPPSFPGIAEVVPRAEELARKAQETREQVEARLRTREFERGIAEAEARFKELAARLRDMGEPRLWDFQRLQDARTTLENERKALDGQLGSISNRLQELEALRREWEDQLSFWGDWRRNLSATQAELPLDALGKAEQTIREVVQEISRGASTLMALQERISRLKEENRKIAAPVEATFNRMRGETFRRTEPAFPTRGFLEHLRSSPFPTLRVGLRAALLGAGESLKREEGVVILQLILVLVLGTLGGWQKRRWGTRETFPLLLRHPWVLALFLVGVLSSLFLRDTTGPFRVFSRCVFAFSVAILSGAHHKTLDTKELLLALAGAMAGLDLLKTIGLPVGWYRFSLALLSLAGALWAAFKKTHGRGNLWAVRLGSGVMAFVFLAQASGYANLADRLFFAFGWSAILLLAGFLVVGMIRSGLARLMAFPTVGGHVLVERLGSSLQDRLCRMMGILVWILIIVRLFPVWGIYPSASEAWNALVGLEMGLGEFRISLGLLLLAFMALYTSLGLSWLLNALLEVQVFPGQDVDPGARHAMGKLIHYFLVLVGLLVAMNLVGIKLESFLVLGGALGVGIGFGLQHVANNFISGLILLFERPVKVGDTVVVDKEWGRVKRIGLRSTVIETFDRSELIVPNSHLVSNTVTNWTLSNPMARVRIQVGVGYSTDIQLALDLLREAAQRNSRVLREPAPAAFFTRFGESSVELELHAWVADVKERLLAQSEIGIEIQRLLGEAGVEIPFPQRDLHIRSWAKTEEEPAG
jgi:potassium efflux system protein